MNSRTFEVAVIGNSLAVTLHNELGGTATACIPHEARTPEEADAVMLSAAFAMMRAYRKLVNRGYRKLAGPSGKLPG